MKKPCLVVSPTEKQGNYLFSRKKCMKCGDKLCSVVSIKDPEEKLKRHGSATIDRKKWEWIMLCQKCKMN